MCSARLEAEIEGFLILLARTEASGTGTSGMSDGGRDPEGVGARLTRSSKERSIEALGECAGFDGFNALGNGGTGTLTDADLLLPVNVGAGVRRASCLTYGVASEVNCKRLELEERSTEGFGE